MENPLPVCVWIFFLGGGMMNRERAGPGDGESEIEKGKGSSKIRKQM